MTYITTYVCGLEKFAGVFLRRTKNSFEIAAGTAFTTNKNIYIEICVSVKRKEIIINFMERQLD